MEPLADEKRPAKRWFLRPRIFDRRKAERRQIPDLVAHYWDGGPPLANGIREISFKGLYLLTEQRWYPGTLVTLTLQRTGLAETNPDRSITVQAKVVRTGSDGVAFAFILLEARKRRARPGRAENAAEEFLRRLLANEEAAD